ncbi:epithelial-stromal interaction protein 1 isoform X2 [Mastacembelus armatus]|uniref:epithelial-stromal interaction protein 1 isoform X2 n=1 Tax=Mastacembelus armatus TaxID=205130 RepID=UPI000E460257|nr:epithelial-stromal interaction protein 1 isoform X2 [Mastacembelus armatus]
MDPHQTPGHHLDSSKPSQIKHSMPSVYGNDQTPENPDRNVPDSGNPQPPNRQPLYSNGFTMIPPIESRRSQMKMMAQKEEEDLQRWKETHRVSAVHETPEKLGGGVTMAAAREKQFEDLRCAKLQKRLKQQELDKKKREEVEKKLQEMKAKQREKAERLKEKKHQEEQRRREQLRQDHLRMTDRFLQRFESSRVPGPQASSSAAHTSSRSEAMETTQGGKSVRDVQLEHKRVNSAFLDKLEGRGRNEDVKQESVWEAAFPGVASEDIRHPSTTGQQPILTHLKPDPEQSSSNWTQEVGTSPPDCFHH